MPWMQYPHRNPRTWNHSFQLLQSFIWLTVLPEVHRPFRLLSVVAHGVCWDTYICIEFLTIRESLLAIRHRSAALAADAKVSTTSVVRLPTPNKDASRSSDSAPQPLQHSSWTGSSKLPCHSPPFKSIKLAIIGDLNSIYSSPFGLRVVMDIRTHLQFSVRGCRYEDLRNFEPKCSLTRRSTWLKSGHS